jgi:hypothetical protein
MASSKINTKELMNVLIYVVFASVIIPIIATQLSGLEGDSANYSPSEILLLGLITTFIILGVVYAIVKTIL